MIMYKNVVKKRANTDRLLLKSVYQMCISNIIQIRIEFLLF